MKFRDLLKESAVGQKGRTTEKDAENHLCDNSDVISEFKKIVKKMGGKSVAKKILDGYTPTPEPEEKIVEATAENIKEILNFLKDSGFKIKTNTKTKRGIELEFYKTEQAKEAYDEMKSIGVPGNYSLEHNFIIIL
jgi:hypothetical protein